MEYSNSHLKNKVYELKEKILNENKYLISKIKALEEHNAKLIEQFNETIDISKRSLNMVNEYSKDLSNINTKYSKVMDKYTILIQKQSKFERSFIYQLYNLFNK